MKKYTFILALGVALTLTACGSGSTATETKDSTVVSTNTTAKPTDSTSSVVEPVTGVGGGAKKEVPQK